MQELDLGDIVREAVRASGTANPYDYAVRAVRPLAVQSLQEAIAGCKDCKMNCNGKCRKSTFISDDVSGVNILVITDYPIDPVDESPLLESEMDLLNQAYEYLEVDKNQIAYMNAVSCKPCRIDSGKEASRPPTSEEVNNCKVFTDYAIKVLQPKLVLLMGNFALNAYVHNVNVKTMHGKWTEVNGIPAMPLYSPSQIAKLVEMDECNDLQEEMKESFGEDLYNAFRWFQEKYPEADFAPKLLREQ